jgi:hypothetical protein
MNSDKIEGVSALHFVFDGPPGPESGRFVECETPDGNGINAGEWRERSDGLWELVVSLPFAAAPVEDAEVEELRFWLRKAGEVLAPHSADAPGTPTRDALVFVNAALNPQAREKVRAALTGSSEDTQAPRYKSEWGGEWERSRVQSSEDTQAPDVEMVERACVAFIDQVETEMRAMPSIFGPVPDDRFGFYDDRVTEEQREAVRNSMRVAILAVRKDPNNEL